MAYIAEPYATPTPAPTPVRKELPIEKQRYQSIDVLKGVSILALWLVYFSLANPNTSDQLKPGSWGQPTFADCIFPALLVGIGASIPLSAAYRTGRNALGLFMTGALSKAFWLVLFGVILDSAVAHRPVADCGALQLLGAAYLINALFARTPAILRFFLAEALLLAFYAWAKFYTIPGGPPNTFTDKFNAIQYFDDKLLDPIGLRGLLALIPFTSIMMSGSVLGSVYLLDESRFRRGGIFIGCGATISFFAWLWSKDQAMVSALWSSSFALYATGFAVIALGIFNILFDFERIRPFTYPLRIPGTCILLAVAGPILVNVMVLDVWQAPGSKDNIELALRKYALGMYPSPLGGWIYPVAMMIVWLAVLAITYHRRTWLRDKCEGNGPRQPLPPQPVV